MIIDNVPFQLMDLSKQPTTRHESEIVSALWRTLEVGNIRVWMVEHSSSYSADYSCSRGNMLMLMQSEWEPELADDRRFNMIPGSSYQVAKNAEPRWSYTAASTTLFMMN